jgi:predicted permease
MATALSIGSIALGISLTTSVFSVADSMLLRPFPLQEPEAVYEAASIGEDRQPVPYSWPDFLDMSREAAEIGQIAAFQRRGISMYTGDVREGLLPYIISGNFFEVLGVRAAHGEASVRPVGNSPSVVLGYGLWRRSFGGDPQVIGRTIILDRKPFVIAGVLPPEFTGLRRGVAGDVWLSADAWFDLLGYREERLARAGQFEIIARLNPGILPARAAAQLDASIRGPAKHKPAPPGSAGTVLLAKFALNWKESVVLGSGLMLGLGLVLFVACANVAQIRLAQSELRQKEFGVRAALGAGVWRMTRQLMVEMFLIAAGGAALGVLFTSYLLDRIATLISGGRVYIDYGIRIDNRVLVFAVTAAVVSIFLAGLTPPRHAVKIDVTAILKSEQGSTGSGREWHRKILIAGQVAVTVALFGLALLFLAGFRNAASVRPGFDPQKNILVMRVSPGSRTNVANWCEQAAARLATVPGVRGASFARRLMLSGSGGGASVRVEVAGHPPLGVLFNNVGGQYFTVMGTRILAGRGIDPRDREGGALVTVISNLMARQFFTGRNPVGEWISINGRPRQIVGISEDGPSNSLHEDPQPYLYLPFAQSPSGDITMLVETQGEAGSVTTALRQELKSFDASTQIYSTITLRQHMSNALNRDRMQAALATGLGLFSVLLTAAGLFGVMQLAVSRHTREFGVRLALGAAPGELQRMVLGDSMKLALFGVPAGLILLAIGAWYLHSLSLGVQPFDARIYLLSAFLTVPLVVVASWIPARRATRIEPMEALRHG